MTDNSEPIQMDNLMNFFIDLSNNEESKDLFIKMVSNNIETSSTNNDFIFGGASGNNFKSSFDIGFNMRGKYNTFVDQQQTEDIEDINAVLDIVDNVIDSSKNIDYELDDISDSSVEQCDNQIPSPHMTILETLIEKGRNSNNIEEKLCIKILLNTLMGCTGLPVQQ